jgi:hypothetical protein
MEPLPKIEVALMLLDRAIKMYFDDEHPLFVMTVAHPAHVLLNDLAQKKFKTNFVLKEVFESLMAREENLLEDGSTINTIEQFINFMHKIPNAAKHADQKTDETVPIEEDCSRHLLVMAVSHADQLGRMTEIQHVYTVWELARQHDKDRPMFSVCNEAFPGFDTLPRAEMLAAGRAAIEDIFPEYLAR